MKGFDQWEVLEARLRQLQVTCTALAVATGVLAGILGLQAWRGVPVHFIHGAQGLSRPGELPDAYAEDIAKQFIGMRYTYTPATVKEVLREAEEMLHPSLTVPFLAHAEKEIGQAKAHHMSLQTTPLTSEVGAREGKGVTVIVTGRQAVYIGGIETRNEAFRAEVIAIPWSGQGKNRIVISKALIDPPLTVSGEWRRPR